MSINSTRGISSRRSQSDGCERLCFQGNWPQCLPGIHRIRLELGIARLGSSFDGPAVRISSDYRYPTDETAIKLLYLALNNISKKWSMPIRDWKAALNRFTIQFEDRLVQR